MTLRRFLVLLGSIALAILLLLAAADLWLLPWLVHQQGEVLVPELVGRPQEEARKTLEDLGLQWVVGEEVAHDEAPPGTVVEQDPPPLRAVRRGRPVRVVLSRGEARVEVPDLVGLSLRQSELALSAVGLRVGHLARSFDPAGALGVVGQRPHARTLVSKGDRVDLLVREGHDRVWHRMPDLVGASLVRVREQLARARFDIRRVTYRDDGRAAPGTILDQWPPAGSRIPSGGSIELVAASRGR